MSDRGAPSSWRLRSGTQSYFKNVPEYIEAYISHADLVLGCVQGITNPAILGILASRQCLLVVPNDDFNNQTAASYSILRAAPSKVLAEVIHGLRPARDNYNSPPIRCVGDRNVVPTFRMNHNFLCLFTRNSSGQFSCTGVLTGAFNLFDPRVTHGSLVLIREHYVESDHLEEFTRALCQSTEIGAGFEDGKYYIHGKST